MKKIAQLSVVFWLVLILIAFIVAHAFSIAQLPVFADEAIYIRWAQLLQDDWRQYLFFPLNDGKTPLFIWQILPLLHVVKDPLIAGRLVSLISGVVQIVLFAKIVKQLNGGKLSQVVVATLVAILPFWYFHHQMALMDSWLSVWLSLTLFSLLKALKEGKIWIVIAGLSLGCAFLTKLPAVLFFPSLVVLVFLPDQKYSLAKRLLIIGTSMIIGVGIFGLLKVSPAFPQLFFRGSDFLYPTSEVLGGKWLDTIKNLPTYITYFWWYLTPGIIALSIIGLLLRKQRKTQLILWLSFLSFVLPIAVMGKVVYPRYFLPAAIPITISAALAIEKVLQIELRRFTKIARAFVIIILVQTFLLSVGFILFNIMNPNEIPFVEADRTQYLTEWSSGHGVKEAVQAIQQQADTSTVAVATEGFFGTLPDAVLMYLHNQNVTNISVEGVGQPVTKMPEALIAKQDTYDRLWVLVNSHRLQFSIDQKYLIDQYCRPFDGPCLQLWDVTEVIRSSNQ